MRQDVESIELQDHTGLSAPTAPIRTSSTGNGILRQLGLYAETGSPRRPTTPTARRENRASGLTDLMQFFGLYKETGAACRTVRPPLRATEQAEPTTTPSVTR